MVRIFKIIGYVGFSKHHKLKLECSSPHVITYTDADFSVNRDDRTSMGSQLVFLDTAPIMWRTSKQKSVSFYYGIGVFFNDGMQLKELMWFNRISQKCVDRKFFNEPKLQSDLFVDNLAAIDFVKSLIENHRTKHIDVKLFFIRNLFFQNAFNIKYVNSKDNIADALTKLSTKLELKRYSDQMFLNNLRL